MMKKLLALTFVLFFVTACKREKTAQELPKSDVSSSIRIDFAKGFSVAKEGEITVLSVNSPWPGADESFTYALVPKNKLGAITFPKDSYDAVVATPINKLVVTSTTHIPALESLGILDKLVGFPDTKYISSLPARKMIQEGKIKDLGQNESLNTEITLALNPDLVVGFAINSQHSGYDILQKANISVVFNGDWVEQTPLGKAEWIKFFGLLLNKEKEAAQIFDSIQKSYLEVKSIASKAKSKPKVLSGALYKDVWYMPAGESWAAKFLSDANADYLYAETEGTGSLSLSLESVLDQAKNADVWVSPSQFIGYQEMKRANVHYGEFTAFQNKKVYTFGATKGPTGGLLYYELAPQRPDLVLKDLVKILHPQLLPDYDPYFFRPLQ